MNILCRSKNLVSSVFKSVVLLEQTRCLCLTRRLTGEFPSSQLHHQLHHQLSTRYLDTKRFYSETRCESSDPKMNSGDFQEETEEDRDSSLRSPETFSLDVLVSLLRQENAVDVCVIKVPEQIKYTQHFIVVSGVSQRHLRAMALYAIKVYKFMKKEETPNVKIEGKDSEDWMCIDFGNMVVHFMLPETREVFELEKLWTLRSYDEQLKKIPAETLPEDFIYDAEDSN